jgi:hypothetical protein
MFQLYTNLLSSDVKYARNKIFQEQTQSDSYTDLQGVSRKGPRGYSRKAFDNCVIFHLLTMFFNNTAEQERYYITNVLKKSQQSACISLYSVWSSSTPTLRNYHADTTVPVPSPVQLLQMHHSLRLIWQVTLFRCAH